MKLYESETVELKAIYTPDFKKEIVLDKNTMLVVDDKLINGRWNVKVDWKYDDQEYMFKKNLFY